MTWHVPSVSSASAPESVCSKSDSDWHLIILVCGRFYEVVSSGTPSARPSSWRGWKNRAWCQRLFLSETFKTWTAANSAMTSTSSAPDSLAKPGPSPEDNVESKTNAGSGETSSPSSTTANPASSSSKTCQDSPLAFLSDEHWRTPQRSLFDEMGSTPYLDRWPSEGSMRNGCIYKQQKWVPPIVATAGFVWPTAQVTDSTSSARHSTTTGVMHPGTSLTDAINQWPTTTATPYGTNQGGAAGRTGIVRPSLDTLTPTWATPTAADDGNKQTPNSHQGLIRDAANWPSPRSEDSESCGNHPEATDSLTGAILFWGTPEASDRANRGSRRHNNPSSERGGQTHLADDVEFWSTPRASENENRTTQNAPSHDGINHGQTLAGQTGQWQSPQARDYKSGETISEYGNTRPLSEQVLDPSPPDQPTLDGTRSLRRPRTSRPRLNPAFTNWLQGNPWWWTRTDPINCAAQEIKSWRHSVLSLLSLLLEGTDDDGTNQG